MGGLLYEDGCHSTRPAKGPDFYKVRGGVQQGLMLGLPLAFPDILMNVVTHIHHGCLTGCM